MVGMTPVLNVKGVRMEASYNLLDEWWLPHRNLMYNSGLYRLPRR